MKITTVIDALRLALSKKRISQKVIYIVQGIIFTPFIVYRENTVTRERRDASDGTGAGDDVYPLF